MVALGLEDEPGITIPFTLLNAVDRRKQIPFRYYQTGSPFEYDLVRLLRRKKSELDIAK